MNNKEPSNEEEQSGSGSSGPRTSERVFLATQTSRVNTPEVVLGMTQRVFLPEGHLFLRMLDRLFLAEGSSGIASASSSGPSLYHLEFRVPMDKLEGDALVSSLMSDHVDSPILEEVSSSMVLPGA